MLSLLPAEMHSLLSVLGSADGGDDGDNSTERGVCYGTFVSPASD